MKKKSKTQAKAAPTQLAKLQLQVMKNYKSGTGKEKFLIQLDKKCYRAKLSSPVGFGAQDLKPVYLDLYTFLLVKFGSKLIIKLDSLVNREVSLYAK